MQQNYIRTQSHVGTQGEMILVSGPPNKLSCEDIITLQMLCTVRLQRNGLAFSHYVTLNAAIGPH